MSANSKATEKAAAAAMNARAKKSTKKGGGDQTKTAVMICGGSCVLAFGLYFLNPPAAFYDMTINNEETIENVNRNSKVWKAGAVSSFEGQTIGDIRDMGSVQWADPEGQWHLCPSSPTAPTEVPANFDARQEWPDCFPDQIYTQGTCSASWAIAAVSSMANRFCIQDPEEYKMLALSPQASLSCDMVNKGCEGGGMDTVWEHLMSEGMVSETCFPYTGTSGAICEDKCANEQPKKIVGKCIAQGADQVKKEIMTNGPITAPLKVSDEVLLYKSGVFLPTRTATLINDGKRARPGMKKTSMVKIIGWGVEDDNEYWLIENSWGSDWGMGGYGKIGIPHADSEQDAQMAPLTVDFTFAGFPSNMKMAGGPPPEEEFDINVDDDLNDINFDDDEEEDVFSDIDLED